MTPFRAALNRLAALDVSGVARSYGLDELPERLNRAQLPALLVLPGEDRPLFGAAGEGFRASAFSGGPKTVVYRPTHLLLVAPTLAGRGARAHLPRLAELIDAYFSALSDASMLDGALLEPASVQIEPGTFDYGGAAYHGCAFRHTWVIEC
jgi:hypothetical protein